MKISPELNNSIDFLVKIARRRWKSIVSLTLVGAILGYLWALFFTKELFEVTTIIRVGQIEINTPTERLPITIAQINVSSGNAQNLPSIRDDVFKGIKGDRAAMDVQARVVDPETRLISITGMAPTAPDARRLATEAAKLLITRHAKLSDDAIGWKRSLLEHRRALRADLEGQRLALSQLVTGDEGLQVVVRAMVASSLGVQISMFAEGERQLVRELGPPVAFPSEIVSEPRDPVRKLASGRGPLYAGLLLGLVLGLAWAVRAER